MQTNKSTKVEQGEYSELTVSKVYRQDDGSAEACEIWQGNLRDWALVVELEYIPDLIKVLQSRYKCWEGYTP